MQELKSLPSAVYLDLEWNCGDAPRAGDGTPDIIEIGLAELDPVSLCLGREANYLVRPRQLNISLRCTAITGITRGDLLRAKPLKDVIAVIARDWPIKATCFAWGDDGNILTDACHKHCVAAPFRHFVDLSRTMQHCLLLTQQLSVRRAIDVLGLPFDGREHMAVADARNIARIHAEMLRRLRSAEPPAECERDSTATSAPTWFAHKLQIGLEGRAAKSKTHTEQDFKNEKVRP